MDQYKPMRHLLSTGWRMSSQLAILQPTHTMAPEVPELQQELSIGMLHRMQDVLPPPLSTSQQRSRSFRSSGLRWVHHYGIAVIQLAGMTMSWCWATPAPTRSVSLHIIQMV